MPRGRPKKKVVEEEEEEEEVEEKGEDDEEIEKPHNKKAARKRKSKSESGDEEEGDEEDEEKVEEPPKKKRGRPATQKKEKPTAIPAEPLPSSTDFSVPKKEGAQIKIVSFNVAGFAACLGKGFLKYVEDEQPDIICLQETKIAEEKGKAGLPAEYNSYFYPADKVGQHGTGLMSKIKPITVKKGLGIAEHDDEGRCITAEYETFFLVNTYVPNSSRGLVNLDYRVKKWDVAFLAYIKKLEETKPVIWCGDLNVAHQEIDLANPKTNKRTAGFTDEERESFTKILSNGLVDTYRHFNPDKKTFSFWSYMGGNRAKNVGWRLDYFIVSQKILPNVKESIMRSAVQGSDHCPILIIYDPSA
eukprot:TRINITY_DN779_c0_g1_i1.p1 TRINITY_DN779_c0_g1~~TRINITY_DN779_c0_g1_i1.p1  ORF type:complete len:359 (+),score=103.79 TRINITY_DN779_c0_g1_i1:68-1144(+)